MVRIYNFRRMLPAAADHAERVFLVGADIDQAPVFHAGFYPAPRGTDPADAFLVIDFAHFVLRAVAAVLPVSAAGAGCFRSCVARFRGTEL